MSTMTIREMRANLGRLDRELQKDGQITLTKNGRPIAKIVPIGNAGEHPGHAALRARTKRLRGSAKYIRQDRDER